MPTFHQILVDTLYNIINIIRIFRNHLLHLLLRTISILIINN